MPLHVLVVASTFPVSDTDPVPTFVKEQVVVLKKIYPHITFSVLAPHNAYASTASPARSVGTNEFYEEYRFHYFWPFRLERLTGRGIVPTLRRNPVYSVLIPFFVGAEFLTLLQLARRLKPDMIYAHWFTPQGITAGLVSRLTKIPFVYTSHSSDVSVLQKIPFGPWLVRYFSQKAQAITVVSRRTLQKLRNFFTDEEWDGMSRKVATIPMGVAVDEFAKPSRFANGKQQKILFLGRLVEKKGVQFLLPAFAAICDGHLPVKLIIAGDGPWLEILKQQARKLKIPDEQIEFVGYVRGDTKVKVIVDADIFVVPSIVTTYGDAEGLPVALMEGLAAGKICIATNESGADDIITNEVNGFLVPQKDVVALEDALRAALKLSPIQRRKMERSAFETAMQFSWVNVARQYYRFLFNNSA